MLQSENIIFEQVSSDKYAKETMKIFKEYQLSIGTDLCFQNFDEELASIPGKYAPPQGRLYLAFMGKNINEAEIVGCVALRPIKNEQCEMKRLYVRPEFRGQKLGQILADKIISEAKNLGYKQMFLDTLTTMPEAVSLYKKLGFKECLPYCYNPLCGALYMSLDL